MTLTYLRSMLLVSIMSLLSLLSCTSLLSLAWRISVNSAIFCNNYDRSSKQQLIHHLSLVNHVHWLNRFEMPSLIHIMLVINTSRLKWCQVSKEFSDYHILYLKKDRKEKLSYKQNLLSIQVFFSMNSVLLNSYNMTNC